MEIPRPAPPRSAPERVMIEEWLDYHRITLEWKCSGLSPEQLRRRAVQPWLASLVERLAGVAVLLLVTHRPGYQPPWHTPP